jgi:hypothetical protein
VWRRTERCDEKKYKTGLVLRSLKGINNQSINRKSLTTNPTTLHHHTTTLQLSNHNHAPHGPQQAHRRSPHHTHYALHSTSQPQDPSARPQAHSRYHCAQDARSHNHHYHNDQDCPYYWRAPRPRYRKRHATMGDKVSGALMKLRGSLTSKPGLKAAGTRRMHGTDGRGARHVY